jgi:drug/metabolite transporter (DMT)-like permease
MISLILAILTSTSLALILKHNEKQEGNTLQLITANYLSAMLLGLGIFLSDEVLSYSWDTMLFGCFLGSLFVYTFFVMAKSIRLAGTALSIVSARISVIIPIILAIFLFDEVPTLTHTTGIVFAFITIFIFYLSLKYSKDKKLSGMDFLYLMILFLGIGINDFFLKLFTHWFPPEEKHFFLLCIFGSALIYTTAINLFKKNKFHPPSFYRGLALGIPNILTSFFLIEALKELKAFIVFPTMNISIIVLTSIAAWAFWREKLNLYGLIAIATGIIAIYFISI